MDAGRAYDEAFDEVGRLRAPYRAFTARTGADVLRPGAEIVGRLTRRPLGDRYTILPIPLVLDDREFVDTVAPGVRQRALALQAFFFDLIHGGLGPLPDTVRSTGLVSQIFDQEESALSELTRVWSGKPREAVRFIYAPDLVRAPDGRWVVLEDNLGCVGGLVDAHLVVERFLALTSTSLDDRVPHGSDLARAVRGWLARIGQSITPSDVLALLVAECSSGDAEASRKRESLERLGVRVFDRAELADALDRGLRLDDIRAVVNVDMRGWTSPQAFADDLFGQRNIPLTMAPGLEALGNKAWLPFLDDVVAFYSGAEPILRTAPTELYRAMPHDPSGWVLKRSNGHSGRDVFFLDEMTGDARARLSHAVSSWGGTTRAVLQRRVQPSSLASTPDAWQRFHVELRPLAFVIGESACLVGEHLSGRALSNLAGGSLGNMSQGAHYLAVLREPTAASSREREAAPERASNRRMLVGLSPRR